MYTYCNPKAVMDFVHKKEYKLIFHRQFKNSVYNMNNYFENTK